MSKKQGIKQIPLLPAALSTEQGNCLIADYVGATKGRSPKEGEFYYLPNSISTYLPRELKYSSSWDWLMPVIEKIHIDRKVSEVSIRPGRTRIWLKEHSYIESPCLPENNSITECWLAVIKFIIWHNQQGLSEGSR